MHASSEDIAFTHGEIFSATTKVLNKVLVAWKVKVSSPWTMAEANAAVIACICKITVPW